MNLHPIFGSKRDRLPPYKFPTRLHVLNYLRYKVDSSPNKRQTQAEKVEKYNEVAKEIITIWKEAYVPCLDENYVTKKIENEIASQITYVKKTPRVLKSTEKKKEIYSELNKVFHIARCKCFEGKSKEEYIYSNCTCSQENKIINFNTYTEQMLDCEARILLSEAEKNKYELMVSAVELSGKYLKRKLFTKTIYIYADIMVI